MQAQQPNKKQDAPAGTGASNGMVNNHLGQSDYIPTSADTQQAIDILHKTLPPDVYESMMRGYVHKLNERLSGNGSDEDLAIESLLPPLRTVPAGQIMQTEYPDTVNLVQDYLISGVWFIYGKPKIGKSWLAGQLALSVASGGKLFDKDVKRGKVLYLALEDGERRLKKRMKLQQWTQDTENAIDYMLPKNFREQVDYLNLGGGKRLLAHIERQNYILTIIDTFSRAFSVNQLKGEVLTDALAPFQEFTQARNKVVIFIDHEPKRNGEDDSAITTLFGGIAKVGVADGVWRLYKERGKGVKIDIEGRDLEDAYSLKLRFDKSLCYWYSEGDAEKIEITERRQEILNALGNLGRCTLVQLEDATGQAKGHLHTRLQDLVTEGIVKRDKTGANVFYSRADE